MGTSTRLWAGSEVDQGGRARRRRAYEFWTRSLMVPCGGGAREHVGEPGMLPVLAADCAERPAPFANEGS